MPFFVDAGASEQLLIRGFHAFHSNIDGGLPAVVGLVLKAFGISYSASHVPAEELDGGVHVRVLCSIQGGQGEIIAFEYDFGQ